MISRALPSLVSAAAIHSLRTIITVPAYTNYAKGNYIAYIGAFDAYNSNTANNGLWSQNFTISPAVFPSKTILTSNYPDTVDFGSVGGYSAISHLNYDGSNYYIPRPTPSRQVNNITQLRVDYDVTWVGTGKFNHLCECYLTNSSHSNGEGNEPGYGGLWEIGFFPYTGDTWFHYQDIDLGNWTDTAGVVWNAHQHNRYITSIPVAGWRGVGSLYYNDYFTFLIQAGVISGSEWYNGDGFGIEQLDNTGNNVFTINHLNHIYTGGDIASIPIDYLPGDQLLVNPNATNILPWTNKAVSVTAGILDLAGGTTAVQYTETIETNNHFFQQIVSIVSQECDVTIIHDIQMVGRDYVTVQIQSADYSSAVVAIFNATTLALSNSFVYGSQISTILSAQIVSLGGASRRMIVRFRKAQASTNTSFIVCCLMMSDANTNNYAGDPTKSIISYRSRVLQDTRLLLTGSPGTPAVFSAYSFVPQIRGGHGTVTITLQGTLPNGLSFNITTGAITGTPSAANTYPALIMIASDTSGQTQSLTLGPWTIAETPDLIASSPYPTGLNQDAWSNNSGYTINNGVITEINTGSSQLHRVMRVLNVPDATGAFTYRQILTFKTGGAARSPFLINAGTTDYTKNAGITIDLSTPTAPVAQQYSPSGDWAHSGTPAVTYDSTNVTYTVTRDFTIQANDTAWLLTLEMLNGGGIYNYVGDTSATVTFLAHSLKRIV